MKGQGSLARQGVSLEETPRSNKELAEFELALLWKAEGKETRGGVPGEVSGAAQVVGQAQGPLLSPKGASVLSLLDAVAWSMRST